MPETLTPGDAWAALLAGSERFAAGTPEHPHSDPARRDELTSGQQPIAAVLGCSDSRVGTELVFDQGLGDLFVVRNAGQVVSETVLGTLEYAVGVLGIPLVVVLGHTSCGAVAAAVRAEGPDPASLPFNLEKLVAQITPAVTKATSSDGEVDAAEVGRVHVEASIGALLERSILISEAVAGGRLALVGARYDLATGRVDPLTVVGTL